jgi:hypothetical protein
MARILNAIDIVRCIIPHMPEVTAPSPRFGPPSRGVTAGDVERAADALLRAGNRPTIDKVRQKVGTGSPNTIDPLLDSWWKRPGSRLDAGPAAFHRLPTALPQSPLLCPLLARGRTRLPPTRPRQHHYRAEPAAPRTHPPVGQGTSGARRAGSPRLRIYHDKRKRKGRFA